MSNHGGTEEITNRSSWEIVRGENPEFQTLTQDAFNEQNIRGFIAFLFHQPEELTRLVQGMTTVMHSNSCPKIELGTTSGTAMPQSEMVTGVHRTRYENDHWPAPRRTTKRHIRTTTDTSDLQLHPKWPARMYVSSTPLRPDQAEYTRTTRDYYRSNSQRSEEWRTISTILSTY